MMNKKLQNILLMLFLAICAGTLVSDSVFPFFISCIKVLLFISIIIFIWIAYNDLSGYIRAYNRIKKETIYKLLFRSGIKSFIVNALTVFRILSAPVLFFMIFQHGYSFKWYLLLAAFISDALDGFLARRFKVTSKLGAKLDSFADDLLFIVGVTCIIRLHPEVITGHYFILGYLIALFIFKMIWLWCKHKKLISGMHTYMTKFAAILQSVFFIYCVFFDPSTVLFYCMVITTIIALMEEIIIITSFKTLRQNAKGLFFHRSQL